MSVNRIFLSILAVVFLASCNNTNNNGFTIVKGTFDTPYKQEVELMKVVNGKEILVSKVFLDDSNEFGFSFKTEEEGFYTIGNPYIEIPIYVKGNEVFNIDYNFNKPSLKYSQSNIPNKENEILFNWKIKTDTLHHYLNFSVAKPATYVEFFPFFKDYISTMKSYHSEINSGNEKFDNVMNTLVDLDIEYTAMQMIFTPRPIHPGKDKLAPFYSDIINESVVFNSNILKLPKGFSTLGMHQLYKSIYVYTDTNRKLASIKMVHSIENDDIKAYYAIDQLRMYKFYNKEYLDYITPLRSAISKFPDLVKIVADHEEEIRVFEKGTPGVEFTFKDINDKDVSFSDFRGKYVYIDFWATWCSPCKKEIPSLKKLENKFHGKDIVFVSISMDKPKVHGKWKEFVKKEGLTGVQLFATDAFNTQVAKEYKINSIPRFMLFDKEGKVVENNAMRPSNPEIEMQLKSLL